MNTIKIEQGKISWSILYDFEDYVLLHNLRVNKKFRNQGWAKLLLQEAIKIIKIQNPNLPIVIIIKSDNKEVDINRLCKFYLSFKELIVYIDDKRMTLNERKKD